MTLRLFTPGPVEIPERVLAALAQRPPHHRSRAYRELAAALHPRLQALFGTEGPVAVLAASGTGGMEAAAASLVRPGARTLTVEAGKFGDRWEKILRVHGHAPRVIHGEWGRPVPAEEIARALEQEPADVVFLTHSETSTATLHDVREQARITRERGALVVVDAITSLGVHELRQDEFGLDVVAAGSQKGLMLPPGLALVGVGPRAIEAFERRSEPIPSFYLDLRKAAAKAPEGDTPYTPAVSLVLALVEAVTMLEEWGLEAVWQRHDAIASAVRQGARAAGYALFSQSPADSVTALTPPEGVSAKAVQDRMRDTHRMQLAGGQDHLKGKIVRVGHMGLAYGAGDVLDVVQALEECAAALGATIEPGRARAAAERSLEEKPCEFSSPTR